MANMFALILVIATLVTGILWCVDKFIFPPPPPPLFKSQFMAPG
ncbi:Signal peptidase I [Cronobacter muytjensii 530]